jgi:hypothetical protein
MQSYGVVLTKFGFLKEPGANWNTVPWIATQAGAAVCRTGDHNALTTSLTLEKSDVFSRTLALEVSGYEFIRAACD